MVSSSCSFFPPYTIAWLFTDLSHYVSFRTLASQTSPRDGETEAQATQEAHL